MLYALAFVAALLVGAGYLLGMRRRHVRADELESALTERTEQLNVAEQELIRHSGARESSLPELLYRGEGGLFEAIRKSFDPARITHPVWDDALIQGLTQQNEWLPSAPAETDALDPGNWERFAARKRGIIPEARRSSPPDAAARAFPPDRRGGIGRRVQIESAFFIRPDPMSAYARPMTMSARAPTRWRPTGRGSCSEC